MSFVFHKIRNGRVKIGGRWFYVNDRFRQYKGELDGLRYAFGVYRGESFVSLWGSEAEYRDTSNVGNHTRPEVVDGGLMPWVWWNEREARL